MLPSVHVPDACSYFTAQYNPHISFREVKLILKYLLYVFKLAPSRGSLVLSVYFQGQHLPWRRTTLQMVIRCWRSSAVRTAPQLWQQQPSTDNEAGGSFGVVYKAIEKSTGEIVAVKHVSTGEQCPRCSQTDKPQGRSRSLRGRHYRHPGRDSCSWFLRQRVCHSIQDSIFARTKVVDSYGVFGRRILSRFGMETHLRRVDLC